MVSIISQSRPPSHGLARAQVVKDERQAALATLFFILNPASVFHASAYTESLFTFCCMAGLYLLYVRGQFWAAVIPFAASSCARSNGILNGGFLLHESLRKAIEQWHRSRLMAVLLVVRGCITCTLAVLPYVMFQYYAWRVYCGSHDKSRPWCSDRIPAVYGFVQSHYWDVGFLKYYQVKQLPNFAVALPLLVFSFTAVYSFAACRLYYFFTGGLLADCSSSNSSSSGSGGSNSMRDRQPPPAEGKHRHHLATSEAPAGGNPTANGKGNGAGAAAVPSTAVLEHATYALVSSSEQQQQQSGAAKEPGRPNGLPPPADHLDCCPAREPERGFFNRDVTVFVFHWGSMAFVALLAMHVQVSTRFLSSCAPVYWFAAHVYSRHRSAWLWWYCLYYMALGALMMPNFYPWT